MNTQSALTRAALVVTVLAAAAGDQWPDRLTVDLASSVPTVNVPATVRSLPVRAPVISECTPENLRASLRPQNPLPAPGQMPAGSTMARIASRGYLIVGIGADSYPFAARGDDRKLEGFDVDLARDISEAIFGDRERVVFRLVPTTSWLDLLTSDQIDLAAAAITITCRRREKVDFSAVYYEAGQRVLVNRGVPVTSLADLRGKEVCASRDSTSLGRILSDPAKPIPVGATTGTDCLMMLQLGSVDAVSTDDALLAGMAEQDPRTQIVGPRFTEEPYGVAISKEAPDLVRFVNAVLERRAVDGRWRASYEHWLTTLGPPPSPPVPQYRD